MQRICKKIFSSLSWLCVEVFSGMGESKWDHLNEYLWVKESPCGRGSGMLAVLRSVIWVTQAFLPEISG